MHTPIALRLLATALAGFAVHASVTTFGDLDCLGQGCYGASNPTAGATLQGLAPNSITTASRAFAHAYRFSPSAGDYAGTGTIYLGSTQTGSHDGYAVVAGRLNGPQVTTMDYSSLIVTGRTLASLTLGIAADDFQFPAFGQPFTVMVNGVVSAALTAQLNAFDESGPVVHFFSIGLNPAVDTGNHILTLSMNKGGDGGDVWAVDFLTIGATIAAAGGVTEPPTMAMLGLGLCGIAASSTLRWVKSPGRRN